MSQKQDQHIAPQVIEKFGGLFLVLRGHRYFGVACEVHVLFWGCELIPAGRGRKSPQITVGLEAWRGSGGGTFGRAFFWSWCELVGGGREIQVATVAGVVRDQGMFRTNSVDSLKLLLHHFVICLFLCLPFTRV